MSELDGNKDLILAELKRINSRLISILNALDILNDRLADFARTLHMRNLAQESVKKRQEQAIPLDQLLNTISANPLIRDIIIKHYGATKQDSQTEARDTSQIGQ